MNTDGENIWKRAVLSNAINTLIENKADYIRLIKQYAELKHEKYEALLNAGFDKKEALAIVIQTPTMG